MFFVIQGDGRFVPIQDDFFRNVELQHVGHGHEVGLNVTNEDFYFGAVAVVDAADASRLFVHGVIDGGVIMESDVVHRVTSESEGYFLLYGNSGTGKREADVSCGADKDDAVLFGEADGAECFSGASGSDVEDEFGTFFAGQGKDLLLVFVEGEVFVFQQQGVFFEDVDTLFQHVQ